jgi:hypothetical protein
LIKVLNDAFDNKEKIECEQDNLRNRKMKEIQSSITSKENIEGQTKKQILKNPNSS